MDHVNPARGRSADLQQDLEGRVFNVVSSTASVVGAEYFAAVVCVLADSLGAEHGFLAEMPPEQPGTTRTIAVWAHGAPTSSAPQTWVGTAAERTSSGALAFYPSNASGLFPQDSLLEVLNAEGFLAVPTYSAEGKPNGYLGIASRERMPSANPAEAVLRLAAARSGAEIDRLHAERALRKQAELLSQLTENAADIIFRFRVSPPAFEYVNPAFERVTGYSREELIKDPQLLVRIMHPEDQEGMQQVLNGASDSPTAWRVITRSGAVVRTEGRRIPIYDEDGALIAYESVIRDVTAEREAQEALSVVVSAQKSLLEAIPDTVLRISKDGRVLDFQSPKGRVAFYSPQQAIGRFVQEILPPEAAALFMQRLEATFATETTQAVRFFMVQDDDEHHFEARVAVSGSDEAMVLIRDITAAEWMTKEESRKQAREQLETKAELQLGASNPYHLTFREYTVLALVAGGAGDKQIANELGISIYTVNKHVSNILAKMGVSSRTEASVRAVQEHLLD